MTCIIIICALITEWHPVSASYYDYGNVDFDVFVQHIPSQKIRRLYLSFYSEPPLPLESEQLLKLMLTAARNVYPDEDIMAKAHYHPNGREADGELLYMEDGSTALWYIAGNGEIMVECARSYLFFSAVPEVIEELAVADLQRRLRRQIRLALGYRHGQLLCESVP